MDDLNMDPNTDPAGQKTGRHNPQTGESQPAGNSGSGNPAGTQPSGISNSGNSATSPDLESLQQELKDAQQKLEEMTGISKRALADLQNFKRRTEEEKAAFIDFANSALFAEMLPAIENIKRAISHDPKDEEWIKGASSTMNQILAVCEKHGLKEIPVKSGDPFTPALHEALLTAPGPKDQILEVLENGYMLGERVLKLTRVKVGNGE